MASVIGVGDMRFSSRPGEILFAPEIGAGIALALHDPSSHVTGILHFLLPSSEADPERSIDRPALFADTGIPAFLRSAIALGASKEQMRVELAGGAGPFDPTDFCALGVRNLAAARSILRREGISIAEEHVGGMAVRALRIDGNTGSLRLRSQDQELAL